MRCKVPVHPEVYEAIQNVDVDAIAALPERNLRPILPCLVRMSLCAPLDNSEEWSRKKRKILQCLSGLEVVNTIVSLLSIDFQALEQDMKKEQQLRSKVAGAGGDSVLVSQLENGVVLEFERSDAARKLRLLLSELLAVVAQVKEGKSEFFHKSSELFQNEVYLAEVSDVLCIAQAEQPSLLPMYEVAEALLHVDNGGWLLCRLIANMPDTFMEVCTSLVANGEKQDEDELGGRRRMEMLGLLCDMNPSQALAVRALCVENCRMPGLAVKLTLTHGTEAGDARDEDSGSLVAFITGLLLGSDQNVKNWFTQFIKNGQKRKSDPSKSMLHVLRGELVKQLTFLLGDSRGQLTNAQTVPATAFIRLYCALKGVAGLSLNDKEHQLLLQLITSQPPPGESGVRFICLALCELLACPALLGSPEQERKVVEWIRWLLKEAANFDKAAGWKSSYGEMLLLIAIHFHSNQTSAIADLVCSTLAMKCPVKTNSLVRVKTIFTQEIFTEKVVTSHAVRVAVTPQLNATIQGYLPVHCIHQLLKSRAFTKYRVPIKDWIYKQICSCTTPIHPLVPSLIEAYINSIILPNTKSDYTNEPITEQQILKIYQKSVVPVRQRSRSLRLSADVPMETDAEAEVEERSKFTTQLLLLYYIMLYQDTLFANMKTVVVGSRKYTSYSQELLAQLPIKHLLQQAQSEQHLYAGLVSPLIRLLATHYPHLCMVEDWLEEDLSWVTTSAVVDLPASPADVTRGFERLASSPSQLQAVLESLLVKPSHELLACADAFIGHMGALLEEGTPRRILELSKKLWVRLNLLMPRRLRVMTVNALRPKDKRGFKMASYTEEDITTDPLVVLQCDQRVFRSPVLLELTLRNLQAYLQGSRAQLTEHLAKSFSGDKPGSTVGQQEREELRLALVATQESAAIQVLLESCLPTQQDKQEQSLLSDLREVQGIVCSCVHQMFISEPSLAKLVHFQGYPSELLSLTVAAIPSMHICLDFIPEMLSQPQMDKQIFAIQLVSHLSLQYALPKALSVARLAINVMSALLSVLPLETRPSFYLQTLSALPRICQAFPPLCEDVVTLLIQMGRVCSSHLAVRGAPANGMESAVTLSDLSLDSGGSLQTPSGSMRWLCNHSFLLEAVQATFTEIVNRTALLKPTR